MRRALTFVTTLAVALSLSACGAGQNAETRKINRVTDGQEATVTTNESNIKVRNLLLVATSDQAAVLVGTIVNTSDESDELLGIAVGQNTASLTGLTTLEKNKPIIFEGPSANAKAVFPGASAKPGTHVNLSLGFAKAGLVTVEVIIRDQRDIYSGVSSGAKLATTQETVTAN